MIGALAGPAWADGTPTLAGRMTLSEIGSTIGGTNYSGAVITGLSNLSAGVASIVRQPQGLAIAFTSLPEYSGPVDVHYVLVDGAARSPEMSVRFDVVRTADLFLDTDIPALINTERGASVRFADIHMDAIGNRLEQLHKDGPAGNTLGLKFADRDGAVTNYADDLAPFYSKRRERTSDTSPIDDFPVAPPLDLGFWSSGQITIGEKPGIPGITFSTGGISFGADYRFDSTLSAGVSAAVSQDYSLVGDTKAQLQGHYAAVYASYQPVPAAFIDAVAGIGMLTAQTDRPLPGESSAQGRRDGWQQYVSLTGGYDYSYRSFTISPYGRLRARAVELDAYDEEGGDTGEAMSFSDARGWALDAAAGARMNWSLPVEMGTLKPGLRAEYRLGTRDTNNGTVSHLGLPAPSYALTADGSAGETIEIGTSLALQWSRGAQIGTDIVNQRRSDDTRSQSLRIYLTGNLR